MPLFRVGCTFRTSQQSIAVRRMSTRRTQDMVHRVANPLPASFLRGGTSKGIFINRAHLPEDKAQWDRIFLGIMGSPDPEYGRQLNGMGGGVSSLSKICVVGPASETQRAQGIDVEYTFVQVGIRDQAIDYSGNCGNLSSMIGVFALDEGLCRPRFVDGASSIASVRSFNTNTNKRIDTTFPVSDPHGAAVPVLDLPQTTMAGVPGEASRIVLEFVSPGGARTGKLLPTGNPVDELDIHHNGGTSRIPISLVDATNPTVFVTSIGLAAALKIPESSIDLSNKDHLAFLENIRQTGATKMGLDPAAQAQPKIAVLGHSALQDASSDSDADIGIRALSMGVLHKAVPMTVGLCLGVAAGVKDTLAWKIVQGSAVRGARSEPSLIRMRHPGGTVDVGADFASDGTVQSAKVVRTGRRLMKGVVWW